MTLEEILPQISRPSRYCGNEVNIIRRNWDEVDLRVALVFPDLYEIGMSHQGLQILYHIINSRSDLLAERAYAPAPDLERLLEENAEPLSSLESGRPLKDFDLLGITLPFELCYTNILTILARSGIAFRSDERTEDDPLVIGGGPCAFHPEPVADFFDAMLLGDGEEAVLEIADRLIEARRRHWGRSRTLEELAGIEGVYVPRLFEPVYLDGVYVGMRGPAAGGRVRRRVLADLEDTGNGLPLVPLSKIVHDRLGIEIARGCTRGCRFCQAGMIYRPVRERSPGRIMELAEKGIAASGFNELALLSLSTGDYSCISDLLLQMMNRMARKRVSVSMPSMRVGTLTPEMMNQIRRVRKTGFTLAPEAGSDRLRRVINKGITEEDLLNACRSAFELGWKLMKFYFMFGLPTETEGDIREIPRLVKRALDTAGKGGGRKINVSVATFVPKPHTPFQRMPQLNVAEGFERIDLLKSSFKSGRFQLKWHDPRMSYLEGVMSRGDRRLSRVIEQAWRDGARLDAWSDYFDLSTWERAAASCGVALGVYLRGREGDEPLPWDHLDCGVDEEFLQLECEKARSEEYTPDCRYHGCQKCGLCDFKTIRPVVNRAGSMPDEDPAERGPEAVAPAVDQPHFTYRVDYSRVGAARFLGHLELIQMFYRVLRRVGLPVCFTRGYNPRPRVTFSPALPVGTESLAEYLEVELSRPLADLSMVLKSFNQALPAGFEAGKISLSPGKGPGSWLTGYLIDPGFELIREVVDDFMAADEFPVQVSRKGRCKIFDARSLVGKLALDREGRLIMELRSRAGQAGLKPMEIIGELFGLDDRQRHGCLVRKEWVRESA